MSHTTQFSLFSELCVYQAGGSTKPVQLYSNAGKLNILLQTTETARANSSIPALNESF